MIVFDLVLATRRPETTGIERYGINLFEAMREAEPDTHAVVMDPALISGKGVVPVSNALGGWFAMPRIAAKLAAGEPVTVVCPSYPASPLFLLTRQKLLRIIHDSFPWTRDAGNSWQGKLLFKTVEKWMLRRYDVRAAPTELTAKELSSLFGLDFDCVGNAPGLDLRTLAPEPVAALDGSPFVLAVGTVEPRKNYDGVLDMLAAAGDAPYTLVVAGRPGWGDVVERLRQTAGPEKRLLWLDDASDGQLAWLYRNCAAFVSLSHAEGFNMPLVEAGIEGCPIVCSDLPIHRSVAAPWAKFVSGTATPSEVAALLQEAATQPRHDAKAYGARFDWTGIARKVEALVRAEEMSPCQPGLCSKSN
ncbi:glycosyltransferase [Methyloligella sp. 2.7D]|uniref:glycosyltransferase n=1 Tax=unclassified Methyloligella TaxID=2625955 RepID=UPI00157DF922|nr:glycosyltransferase [Methyloligella sp. GL2]QKP78197.1 glycosyltransferase [Methyloligella sp. GL2]